MSSLVISFGAVWLLQKALFPKQVELVNASSEPDPLADERPAAPVGQVQTDSGSSLSISSLLGSVVIVHFWTAECSTCLLELPQFSELQKHYETRGLRVLAVNLDSQEVNSKKAKEIWDNGNFQFEPVFDPQRTFAGQLGVSSMPVTIVLDRKGRVAFQSFGANDWSAKETAQMIEDLLLEGP